MLYVAMLSFKQGLSQEKQMEGLGRRAAYQFPAGFTWKAEYWPAGPTQVICIGEADSFEPMMRLMLDWQDIFDINIYPATTPEEGLQIGGKIMAEAASR